MKRGAQLALAALVVAVIARTCTCTDERAAQRDEPRVEPISDGVAGVADAAAEPESPLEAPEAGLAPALPAPPRRCPSEMVDVAGEFCIDRYEASLIDHERERPLSPFYHPTRARTRSSYEAWKGSPAAVDLRDLGLAAPALPAPPAWQLAEVFEPRAQSRGDVWPNGYLSGQAAQMACENAGKRLCSESEWVRACRGEDDLSYPYGDVYEPGACNVSRDHHPAALLHGDASTGHRDPRLNLMQDDDGPLLRPTGSLPRCRSRWGDDGIYDMVGNLDEWIDDPSGVFLGGFFSRQTEAGCGSRIKAHPFGYFDYSLGARCCL